MDITEIIEFILCGVHIELKQYDSIHRHVHVIDAIDFHDIKIL